MAGGPSTPELVGAADRVGGLGMLASGYLGLDALRSHLSALTDARAFGVNLFVPSTEQPDAEAVAGYRRRLQPLAEQLGVELPTPRRDDDAYPQKVELLAQAAVPVVSFTFGLPDTDDVRRLHRAGCHLMATVTTPEDAELAASIGLDSLCVQGPEAGGHRATFRADSEPATQPLTQLLEEVRHRVKLPLVAAGGIVDTTAARAAFETGARAVQVGTALLRTPEAGTSATHRSALDDPGFTDTVVTRAFSGRPARALRNAFVDDYGSHAPAAYPQVNQLTGPIRRAASAAGDPRWLHLWAGTAWRHCPSGEAAAVLAAIVPDEFTGDPASVG